MAQIGTIRLQTQNSGIVDIPVFDPADVSTDALRVQTATGVGAIPIVDPASATYNFLRIQTASGVLAVHDAATLVQVIDSFEDNDMVEWYSWSTGGMPSPTQPSFGDGPVHGSYVLHFQNNNRCASASGGANSGGLANYPIEGDHWTEYVRFAPAATDAVIVSYFSFPTSEDNQPYENSWEIRFDAGNSLLSLESNNSDTTNTSGDVRYADNSVTYNSDTWYRCEIYHNSSDSPTTDYMVVELYDPTDTRMTQATANPDTDHDWNNPSVAWLAGGGFDNGWVDYMHIPG